MIFNTFFDIIRVLGFETTAFLLGCRQAVRHGPLEPAFGGSNPPTPATFVRVMGTPNR